MEKQLIPQLRFPNFIKENYKSVKFGSIIKDSGYGPRFNGNDYDVSGNVKTIRGTDISLNGEILYNQVPVANLDESFIKNHILVDGDLVMITTADCGLTGVFREQNISYIPSAYAIKIGLKDNASPIYFKYFFQTSIAKNQINRFVRKATVANLPGSDIPKLNINIPLLPEQQKIASFLTDVDNKITKLTKKKELLEQYKKGIMQKIFNQELRFKDDEGKEFPNWQKNKLGKSVKFLKGKGLPKSEIVCDGQYKCIHYGELFTKYNELIDKIISRTNDNDKTILSKVNDVLMPTSDVTPNGLATASCIKESDVILGGDVLIIRQDIKKIEGVYLAYYIKHFRNDVMKLVSGSTVYHLYGSDMKNLQVLIPCLDEQIKIANFLTDIDLKIKVLNTKIESNQTFKKGLLQKMFV